MTYTPPSEGVKLHRTYRATLLELAASLEAHDFLHREASDLRKLADDLQSPFNIAVFGRMKTGKSTIINAMIGKKLAVTGVEETTATINKLTYATGDKLSQFTVHWLDREPEDFPIDRLQTDWTGKSDEVTKRVSKAAWLEVYSDAPTLKDIQMTDTPGTGATTEEHEVIARQFIKGQEADALLYVFSPTDRHSDEDDLELFRKSCLTDSSVDNSLAILHKWDHIYWEEDDRDRIQARADRIHQFMQTHVSAVIPVSGPIALLAQTAPEAFWRRVAALFAKARQEEQEDEDKDFVLLLGEDEDEWEEELEGLCELYAEAKNLGCPMASFRVAMRHLYREGLSSSDGFKSALMELSGLRLLMKTLNERIFSLRKVIQQKQNCARARRVMDSAYKNIEKELGVRQRDVEEMEHLLPILRRYAPESSEWMQDKHRHLEASIRVLQKNYADLDRNLIKAGDLSDAVTSALDLLPRIDTLPDSVASKEMREQIRRMLFSLFPFSGDETLLTVREAMALQVVFNRLATMPSVEEKHMADALRKCLMQCAFATA